MRKSKSTLNPINIFWFRRDLRIHDNVGLFHAIGSGKPTLLVFIFDDEILNELPKDDHRVSFIYSRLKSLNRQLGPNQAGIYVVKGEVLEVWQELYSRFEIESVFSNKDYEPYAIKRDMEVRNYLASRGINFFQYKDQVIFEENEIVKSNGSPYTIYTPYKNKWKELLYEIKEYAISYEPLIQADQEFPSLESLGFRMSSIKWNSKLPDAEFHRLYSENRDYPSLDSTTKLSIHLRFGTVSVRDVWRKFKYNQGIIDQLIWREFFMQILYHFPHVTSSCFRPKYNGINWRNNVEEFELWKAGKTGYPLVDAGMRELNQTGYMHNRVRMLTASFLCKHLLIDWRWGEAYFASRLFDYDLALNNGNWQWAAGTGCDAAPYFRIFNPTTQVKRFDSKMEYINKWVPEFNTLSYPNPIVEHKFARERALKTYKETL